MQFRGLKAGLTALVACGVIGCSTASEGAGREEPPPEPTFVRGEGEHLTSSTPVASVNDLAPPPRPGAPWTLAGSLFDPDTGESTAALWHSADAGGWDRTDLPPGDPAVSESFAALVPHADGRLAIGTVGVGPAADVAVWRESAGSWERVEVDGMGGEGGQHATEAATDGARVLVLGYEEVQGDTRARLWLSDDGAEWRTVDGGEGGPFDVEGDEVVSGVAISGDTLIAVGSRDESGGPIGLAWSSDDGKDWRLVEVPAPADAPRWSLRTVAARGGGVVAGGESGGSAVTWWSADGRSWEGPTPLPGYDDARATSDDSVVTRVVADDDGGWLAIGGNGWRPHAWRSTDGRSWALLPNPAERQYPGGLSLVDIAAGDGTVVMAAANPAVLRLADDGWHASPSRDLPDGGARPFVAAVAAAGDTVVAAGGRAAPGNATGYGALSGAVWQRTPDGTWQRHTVGLGEGGVAGLAATASGLVAVGREGRDDAVLRGGDNHNPDGVIWRQDPDGSWQRLGAEPLGEVDARNPEGPWPGAQPASAPPVGGPGTSYLTDVVPLGQGFVAVGAAYDSDDTGQWQGDGLVAVSADGAAWFGEDAQVGGPGDQDLAGACAAPDGSVVVVGTSSDRDRDAALARRRAPDGTWSAGQAEGGAFAPGNHGARHCAAGDDGYLAVGWVDTGPDVDAAVWTSGDGVTWVRLTDEALAGPGDQEAASVVAVPGGGWLVGGADDAGGDADAALWRVTTDGEVSRRDRGEDALGGRGDQRVTDMVLDGEGVVLVGDDHDRIGLWESPVIDR